MPITTITIENFKCIQEPITVHLRPITLLFGANSSGKSTIIQALHYARELFDRENTDPDFTKLGGNTIDLGGFESIVYQHNKTLPIRLRFDIDISDEDLPRYLEGFESLGIYEWEQSELWAIPDNAKSAWVELLIVWSEQHNKPFIKFYSVGINGEILAELTTSDDQRQINISRIYPFNPIFLKETTPEEAKEIAKRFIEGEEKLTGDEIEKVGEVFLRFFAVMNITDGVPGFTRSIPLLGQRSAMPRWEHPLEIERSVFNKEISFEDEGGIILLLSSLIVGPGELVRNYLQKFCYLGPLRTIPSRNFLPIRTPDDSRWSNGLAAWDILHQMDQYNLREVNKWLSGETQLNSGYKIIIKDIKEMDLTHPSSIAMMQESMIDDEVTIKDYIRSMPSCRRLALIENINSIEVQPLDIGVGISQVLPVIVAALNAKNGFVVIEQPELHVHPAFQVALGDLFIEITNKRPDVTFILETHSEHLMLRFLRRIRETKDESLPPGKKPIEPDQLRVYYMEKRKEGISALNIRIDQEGEFIDKWPKGFFEERMKELF